MHQKAFWGLLLAFTVYYATFSGLGFQLYSFVRGIAVPEMLTCEAYGAINSLLAIRGTIAKASAPLGVALLWAVTGLYDAVLVVVLASSTLVVAGFWFAAAQTFSKKRPDTNDKLQRPA